MKKVAILGFGSMGRLHYDVWKAMKGVRVAAVCDKNPAGFKQPARAYGLVDVSSGDALSDAVAIYTDIAPMLAEVKPDIVDITLPTRFHADAAPGGKALHLAHKLQGSGYVEARDISEYKVGLMQENIERKPL